jgi:hypothetical protein
MSKLRRDRVTAARRWKGEALKLVSATKVSATDSEALTRISGFKLKIELVPSPLWYRSLRSLVSPAVWDNIRHGVYGKGGYKCAICGYAGGKLYCHEVWLYDDELHVQRLSWFEAVCQWCNGVKHIGVAAISGDVDYNTLIRHFRRVNDCSYEDFVEARRLAFEIWEARSEFEWTQDFGEYAGMVVAVNDDLRGR